MSNYTPGPWAWQDMGGIKLVGQHGMRPIVLGARGVRKSPGCPPPAELVLRNIERDLLIPFAADHPDARLIAAAPQLAEALRGALLMLNEGVASDCAHCGGEGGWEDRERDAHGRAMTEPRMTPVEHRADCVIVQAKAALRAAGVEP